MYVENSARNVAGVLRCEKPNHFRNLLGLTEATQRNLAGVLREGVFSTSNESRAHDVHANSVGSFRLGESLREMNDSGLGYGIGQRVGPGSDLGGMHSCDVDDVSLLSFPHRRKRLSAAQNDTDQVAAEDPAPLSERCLEKRLVQEPAHVVDQQIDDGTTLRYGIKQKSRSGFRGHIGLNGHSLSANALDLIKSTFGAFNILSIVENRDKVALREFFGNEEANSPCASRDEGIRLCGHARERKSYPLARSRRPDRS